MKQQLEWVLNDMRYCAPELAGEKMALWAAKIEEALASPPAARCECPQHGAWLAAEDIYRMVRELDVAMNGYKAAKQASLCDIFEELKEYIEAAKADVVVAAAQEQKPVAWMHVTGGNVITERNRADMNEMGQRQYSIPLFASPIPASPVGLNSGEMLRYCVHPDYSHFVWPADAPCPYGAPVAPVETK